RLAQLVLFGLLLALVSLLSRVDAKGGPPDWAAGLKPYRGELILAMLAALGLLIAVRFVAFYTDVRMAGATWNTLVLAGVSEAFARGGGGGGARKAARLLGPPGGRGGGVVGRAGRAPAGGADQRGTASVRRSRPEPVRVVSACRRRARFPGLRRRRSVVP